MKKKANISDCGKYRYSLERHWGEGNKTVIFVGLNPSIVDAEIDDPTIRRCINFAKSWGYDRLIMLNIFAYWSTDPKGLLEIEDPIGPENNQKSIKLFAEADLIVCAWGSNKLISGDLMFGSKYLRHNPKLMCLGKTKNGQPRHPLYVKGDTKLIDY